MSDKKYVPVPLELFGIGIARYPKFDEPDTKGTYADNKYKTEIVVSPEKTKEMKKWLEDQAAIIAPDILSPRLPMRKGKKDGVISFVLKSKDKPKLWDAKGNRIPNGAVKIGGGSKIRVGGSLSNYDTGVNFYLSDVQLIELVGRTDIDVDAVDEDGAFVYDGPDHVVSDITESAAPGEVVDTPAPKGKFDL
jgi:hypothetical protein